MKNLCYYLDTNILVFVLSNRNEIDSHVLNILTDCSNLIYTSSVAVKELVLLFRIGKLRSHIYKSEKDLLESLSLYNIQIVFFNQYHFSTYASLQIANGHKDMNDHAIITQALSDKISVISSDIKFKDYISQGLQFIYNKR